MITKDQTEIFKKLIGSKHCAKIQKYMEEQGIVSQLGKPYGTPFISLVFNGHTENAAIEQAVWDLAEQLSEERKVKKAKLEDFLESTKEVSYE